MTHTVMIDQTSRETLRRFTEARGVEHAAREIGVSQTTLLRALAAFPVQRCTLRHLRDVATELSEGATLSDSHATP